MRIDLSKVYFEEKNNIGYIVINDPPANKTSMKFLEEFCLLVSEYVATSKVKGIIISGNGRHFSSGADVEQLKETYAKETLLDDNGDVLAYPIRYLKDRRTFAFFNNLSIPVISAVNGMCIGSGFELVLNTHIRICGKGSILGLPESTFGFLPGLSGTLRYVELIGFGKALELVLSGDTITAQEANEMGIVHNIVDKKEVLTYCEKLMEFILSKSLVYSKKYIIDYINEFNKSYTNEQ